MHLPGLFQLLVIALIVLVLFGRGKVSEMMGDVGQGVKNFRKSLADEEDPAQPVQVDGPAIDGTLAETVEPSPAPDPIRQ